MAKVCGSPEQAELLISMIRASVQKIEEGIEQMRKASKEIQGGFKDDGFAEIEKMIKNMELALAPAREEAPGIERKLQDYAEFLRSLK